MYCYYADALHKTETGCEIEAPKRLKDKLSRKEWRKFVDKSKEKWARYLSGYKGK
jgi:hypothetical protein